jgi:hypothetical protein
VNPEREFRETDHRGHFSCPVTSQADQVFVWAECGAMKTPFLFSCVSSLFVSAALCVDRSICHLMVQGGSRDTPSRTIKTLQPCTKTDLLLNDAKPSLEYHLIRLILIFFFN